jgi:hypothetical protein
MKQGKDFAREVHRFRDPMQDRSAITLAIVLVPPAVSTDVSNREASLRKCPADLLQVEFSTDGINQASDHVAGQA